MFKHASVFASSDDEVPGTDALEYKISLRYPDQKPIQQRAYRVPQSKRSEIDQHIDKLLDADIITPSASPWSSPVVLVSKSLAVADSPLTIEL